MQKFDNGDEVEVKVSLDSWINALYIGIDPEEKDPVVKYLTNNEYDTALIENIRPKQLICDKAREVIESDDWDNKKFYVKFETENQFKEYESLNDGDCWNKETREDAISKGVLFRGMNEMVFNGEQFQELNLSTGEIVPVEGVTEKELDKAESVLAENKELVKSIEIAKEMNDTALDKNKYLINELKEKDESILQLNIHIDDLNGLVKEKVFEREERNKAIAEYKDHYDSHMHKISNLEEHLDSSLRELKEKDGEIEKFKAIVKEQADLLKQISYYTEEYK